jgi:hypothetical protein
MFGVNLVRVTGTLILPSSLGNFVVAACAMAWCWSGYSRRTLLGLTLTSLSILVLNASASAWFAAIAALAVALFARLPPRWRPILLLSLLPTFLLFWAALPALTGRSQVHDSLWGRIAPVAVYANEHLDARQLLFGIEMGLGTNALAAQAPRKTWISRFPDRPVGDSTPAALLWQFGLVGVACAYGMFGLALRRDPESRPLGAALLVSSAALNVTELFPVNLMLGFWLAHAISGRK